MHYTKTLPFAQLQSLSNPDPNLTSSSLGSQTSCSPENRQAKEKAEGKNRMPEFLSETKEFISDQVTQRELRKRASARADENKIAG